MFACGTRLKFAMGKRIQLKILGGEKKSNFSKNILPCKYKKFHFKGGHISQHYLGGYQRVSILWRLFKYPTIKYI